MNYLVIQQLSFCFTKILFLQRIDLQLIIKFTHKHVDMSQIITYEHRYVSQYNIGATLHYKSKI